VNLSFFNPIRTLKLAGLIPVLMAVASLTSHAANLRVTPETAADNSALTLVTAPGSTAAAVSDPHQLLVIGTREGKLLVYPLKDNGSLDEAPSQTVDLLHPAVSLLFHPRMPLLYVWQNPGNDQTAQTQETVPHLLIYRCEGQRLQLLSSIAQGPDFGYDRQRGMLALDGKQERLFIPIGLGGTKKLPTSVAYYRLTAQGLPVQAAGAARPEPKIVPYFFYFTGNSIVPNSNGTTVLTGALAGPCFVDLEKPQAIRQHVVPDTGAFVELVAHPHRPLIYFTTLGSSTFLTMEHLDGILTQLPHGVALEGAEFRSAPVVMSARSQVAVGSPRSVVVIDLDKEGRPSGKARVHKVDKIEGESAPLVYSEKFNRLYVPVK